ncbi:MAG: D-arabinono-1,4-lactone oxidase [Acidothermaceae bacterium]
MRLPLTNWAGNVTFEAARFQAPASSEELQALVAQSESLRVLGTAHSFNHVADTRADLVSVAALPASVEIDRERLVATVSAGMRYGDIATQLHTAGVALRNLGSLPHISVAGACATGTHGSGATNGGLATSVNSIEIIKADGEIEQLSRENDPDVFVGSVVSLGCLGVITKLGLDIVPTFDVEQYVYDNLPGEQLLGHFNEIVDAAYSVSLFTTWRSADIDQVWVKHKVDPAEPWRPEPRWMGASLADSARHPISGMPVSNCTAQLGEAGAWHQRLPHFRLEFTPSAGDELQSEYLLPRGHAPSALRSLLEIADRIAPILQISEIRTIAADDLWLSPSYGRDSVAFHFTWIKDDAAVRPVLGAIEERLAPFEARPHWGKVFTIGPNVVRDLYPRFADFEKLMRRFDPRGKFRNGFVDRYFK